MTIEELRTVIESKGLKTTYDSIPNKLVILSKNFEPLGQINQDAYIGNVTLNDNFYEIVNKQDAISISKSLFDFMNTPIESR